MSGKLWIMLGASLAGLAVAMGAFGAHGIDSWIDQQFGAEAAKRKEYWETAARYQMYHALGIMLFGVVRSLTPPQVGKNAEPIQKANLAVNLTGWSMLLGIIIFSGCLYLMATTNLRLGMIVPIGGTFFILGWIFMAIDAAKIKWN